MIFLKCESTATSGCTTSVNSSKISSANAVSTNNNGGTSRSITRSTVVMVVVVIVEHYSKWR